MYKRNFDKYVNKNDLLNYGGSRHEPDTNNFYDEIKYQNDIWEANIGKSDEDDNMEGLSPEQNIRDVEEWVKKNKKLLLKIITSCDKNEKHDEIIKILEKRKNSWNLE